MSYFPFLYHIVEHTLRRDTRIHTTLNHFPFYKDKYNFLPCFSPFLSHKSVTHKQSPNVNDS